MKILKQRKTLMLISCLILIIFVTACGKEDKTSNELVGNTYKAIQDGKVEANFTFEKDGTLKMVSAQGKFNAGEELRANYEVVHENNKSYLITHNVNDKFFTKSKYGFLSADYFIDKDRHDVSLIKVIDNKNIEIRALFNKKTDNLDMKGKEDIKNLEDDNVVNFKLEKINDN
ncbi:hypothetical protein [Staphylococcus haemolyticus]|uniref:hypothetical protein n=1 Tax=Staphylococcus haemolyticus TaxID=1283 RepID=UPI001F0B5E8A|nr:hypothetical protein [Staphylococcus haemolyticus]MCH4531728.1 hypothetical protein [Staphylococcus haemolyticus]